MTMTVRTVLIMCSQYYSAHNHLNIRYWVTFSNVVDSRPSLYYPSCLSKVQTHIENSAYMTNQSMGICSIWRAPPQYQQGQQGQRCAKPVWVNCFCYQSLKHVPAASFEGSLYSKPWTLNLDNSPHIRSACGWQTTCKGLLLYVARHIAKDP